MQSGEPYGSSMMHHKA